MSFEMEWYGENVKKRVLSVTRKNVDMSAKRVMRGAKKRVPVDTGGLKESIADRKWENKGVVGSYVESGEKGQEHIATFVEIGTPGDVYTGGAYKGQKRTPLPAKPYLRPALKEEKRKFVNSFKDAL